MYQALAVGGDPDPDAALVRFAETLTASEATVLRQALDGMAGKARTTRR
jgi:hypothetical protein